MVKCVVCNINYGHYNHRGLKPEYCGKCRKPEMINFYKRKCVNCDKEPLFNYSKEKTALYCSKHKLDGMTDIMNRKCLQCDKRPHYNYSGKKRALYCNDHKLSGMVNTVSKMCLNCNKRPSYNYKEEKTSLYCDNHKLDGMVCIRSMKCIVCNDKQPVFNHKGESKALYCAKCKIENMTNVAVKRCLTCNKPAYYNHREEKRALYCIEHKLDGMASIMNKKCSHCNFNKMNQKYKPHCAQCYYFLNPNEPAVRNYKVKENTIMQFVKDKYPDIILDSVISGGCSKRRPDGLIEFELFSVIIEVDENCHRNYEDICENKRLMEIYQDLNFRPLRVIRFNPDSYTSADNKKHNSIFSIDKESKKLKVKSKKELDRRVQILLETIDKTVKCFNVDDKSIILEYLFFVQDE